MTRRSCCNSLQCTILEFKRLFCILPKNAWQKNTLSKHQFLSLNFQFPDCQSSAIPETNLVTISIRCTPIIPGLINQVNGTPPPQLSSMAVNMWLAKFQYGFLLLQPCVKNAPQRLGLALKKKPWGGSCENGGPWNRRFRLWKPSFLGEPC